MITRFVFRLLTVLVAAMLLLPITLMAADAPSKPAPGSSPGSSSEVTVVTHPICKANVYNSSAGSPGVFAVGIGRNHPVPDASLFYSVDPVQVLPGQEVRVSANVCNSGEEKGSLAVSLRVNGAVEQSQSVSVSGGSCKEVVFTVARAVPGTYQLSVNGMVGQFSVLAPRLVQASVASTRDTGLGTWGIFAIVAVIVVLIAGLVAVFKTN